MMKEPKIIISGGGTGGHIYPAISIANEFKRRYPSAKILFVGAKNRMEMQKVPQAGYEIKGLWISGIQRKLTWSNLMFPFKLISSLWKSGRIIKKFQPDIAVGTGGFASGPLLKMAAGAGIPTLLQEQNSFPGITNKWLAKKADTICVAYDQMERYFPKAKIKKTGNPVRNDLLKLPSQYEGITEFQFDPKKKTVLIIGGSLGARRINELIESNLDFFMNQKVQVLWQCGKLYVDEYKKYSNHHGVQVKAYLDRMNYAYAVADVIISRAGAGSVSELCIVGKPVLFIPSPNVAEDHQTKNAMAIVHAKGAKMLKEEELDEKFQEVVKELLSDPSTINELSENISKLALPDATKDIVDEIEKLINK